MTGRVETPRASEVSKRVCPASRSLVSVSAYTVQLLSPLSPVTALCFQPWLTLVGPPPLSAVLDRSRSLTVSSSGSYRRRVKSDHVLHAHLLDTKDQYLCVSLHHSSSVRPWRCHYSSHVSYHSIKLLRTRDKSTGHDLRPLGIMLGLTRLV